MKNQGVILIGSSGLLYGIITVGGSLFAKKGLSALDISFFFLSLSLIPLIPFVISKDFFSKILKSWRYLLSYSLINGGLVILQFESLILGVTPAISALLLYTQPVWTIVFGKVFLQEQVNRSRVVIVILALSGAFLIADPFSEFRRQEANPDLLYGEVAALIGAVFLSLWIILGRKGRLAVFARPVDLVFAVRGSTLVLVTIFSILATLFSGGPIFFSNTPVITQNIFYLAGFAILAGAAPDFLFYSGIGKVDALRAGVILLLEPISATVLSAVLLIMIPNPIQIIGGALILLSNYFVNRPSFGQRET